MKIALLTYSTKPRGSVIHTLELAEALQGLGHQVCIYALDKDANKDADRKGFDRTLTCDSQLITALPSPSEIDRLIQQRIQEFVDYFVNCSGNSQLDFDIYHAQDCIGANALAILRAKGIIPHFIRTVHHIEDYNSIYLQQCQDRSIRAAELCLCVSDRWQSQLLQNYQIHAPRVINGINAKRFSQNSDGSETELKQRLGLTGSPIYLTVGGIEPRKNSINLLQAFARVLADFPKAQLAIAGGATLFDYQAYRDEFFAIANAFGIEIGKSLIVTGVLSNRDLPRIYRCADAFVFPSIKEGWGLVIFEAIASGLPVITSKIAPFTEFLNPDQALLVDPDDIQAIAASMRSVCDRNLANALVIASQALLSDYSWLTSAKMHQVQYQKLLDGL